MNTFSLYSSLHKKSQTCIGGRFAFKMFGLQGGYIENYFFEFVDLYFVLHCYCIKHCTLNCDRICSEGIRLFPNK